MSGTTANMNASLTLRLQDRLSMGLAALKSRLDGLRDSAERIGALGAIGAGLAIGMPIIAAARLDDQLRAIAINAGLAGREAEEFIDRLRRSYQRLALQTGQTTEAVVAGAALMIQRGMPSDLIERMLPIAARVATAASADLSDVAGVAESLNASLGVLPDQLERAMAMLVVAAKQGKVELRDMAKEFPALAAAANNFGLRGVEGVEVLATALQVAAKASATPAEASNNLANLFASLTRPETLRNFEKMGVDFPAVMKDAADRGINPLEAAIAKVIQLTRGDPFRLGALIGDMQAGRALLPFLRDAAAEYLRIRGVVGDASVETIVTDFQTRMAGPTLAIARATETLSQVQERFGRELFARLDLVVVPLEMMMRALAAIDELAPDLVGNMLRFLAVMLALAVVLGVVAVALPIIVAGFRILMLPIFATARVVALLVAGLKALAIGGAVVAAPLLAVLAVVAALAGIAVTIWANWERFEGWFSAMWGGLRAVAQGFVGFLDGVFSADMGRIVAGLRLMWEGFREFFIALWGTLAEVLNIWFVGVSGFVAGEIQPLIDGFKQVWAGLETWFSDLWDRMMAPINRWLDRVTEAWTRARRMMGLAPAELPAGGEQGGAAGDFISRPGAPRQRVDFYMHLPPGFGGTGETSTPWLELIPRPSEAPQRGMVQGRP